MPRPPKRDEPLEADRADSPPPRPRPTSWAGDDRHADLLARIGTPVAPVDAGLTDSMPERARRDPRREVGLNLPQPTPRSEPRTAAIDTRHGTPSGPARLGEPPPFDTSTRSLAMPPAPTHDAPAGRDVRTVAQRLADAGDAALARRGVIEVEAVGEPLLSWRELVFVGGLAAACLGYAWIELDRAPSAGPPRAAAIEESPERPVYEWTQEEREQFVPPAPDEASFIPETEPPGERFFGRTVEELLPGVPDDQILVVTSDPSGALVSLGDERLGVTPLVLPYPLRVGTELVVTLDGYRPARGRVGAVERGRRRLDVVLVGDAPAR
jgi:hypothetical protein